MFQYTGEHIKHPSIRKNGIDYYTFTPAPLLHGVPLNKELTLGNFLIINNPTDDFLTGWVKNYWRFAQTKEPVHPLIGKTDTL